MSNSLTTQTLESYVRAKDLLLWFINNASDNVTASIANCIHLDSYDCYSISEFGEWSRKIYHTKQLIAKMSMSERRQIILDIFDLNCLEFDIERYEEMIDDARSFIDGINEQMLLDCVKSINDAVRKGKQLIEYRDRANELYLNACFAKRYRAVIDKNQATDIARDLMKIL